MRGERWLVSGHMGGKVCYVAEGVWRVRVSLAARSRTYFWRKRADAAVDYGLGRTDVRGGCCFGHDDFVVVVWLLRMSIAVVATQV